MAFVLRWGILGSGLISSDFVTAVQGLQEQEHQIVAVAARQLESAQGFSKKFGIPKAYGNYGDVMKDPDVEIVYVGTINSNHYELTKQLLEHGKHVLCEKPLVLNARRAKELVNLARDKKLFLMEGYWSRCFPIYRRLAHEITSGSLGQVIQVNATFSVKIDHVERVIKKELGGGALLDIGIYALQLASLAFGGQKPEKIAAVGHLNEHGVDEAVCVSLLYKNGGMASLNMSTRQVLPNEAYVVGTNGYVKIEQPFWCSTKISMPDDTTYSVDLPKIDGHFNFKNSEGLSYEAQEVARCLKQGLKESPLISLDESILLAEICDEIRKQIGVKYDCD